MGDHFYMITKKKFLVKFAKEDNIKIRPRILDAIFLPDAFFVRVSTILSNC